MSCPGSVYFCFSPIPMILGMKRMVRNSIFQNWKLIFLLSFSGFSCYSIVLQTAYLHICCDQSDHVVVESIKSFRTIQSDQPIASSLLLLSHGAEQNLLLEACMENWLVTKSSNGDEQWRWSGIHSPYSECHLMPFSTRRNVHFDPLRSPVV